MVKAWTLYIIEAENGSLYTGITTCLDRRLESHEKGRKGARFFRLSAPKKVLYTETFPDRSTASKREAEIKKMSRTQKLRLIQ